MNRNRHTLKRILERMLKARGNRWAHEDGEEYHNGKHITNSQGTNGMKQQPQQQLKQVSE